jgi:hypothetical protein
MERSGNIDARGSEKSALLFFPLMDSNEFGK